MPRTFFIFRPISKSGKTASTFTNTGVRFVFSGKRRPNKTDPASDLLILEKGILFALTRRPNWQKPVLDVHFRINRRELWCFFQSDRHFASQSGKQISKTGVRFCEFSEKKTEPKWFTANLNFILIKNISSCCPRQWQAQFFFYKLFVVWFDKYNFEFFWFVLDCCFGIARGHLQCIDTCNKSFLLCNVNRTRKLEYNSCELLGTSSCCAMTLMMRTSMGYI